MSPCMMMRASWWGSPDNAESKKPVSECGGRASQPASQSQLPGSFSWRQSVATRRAGSQQHTSHPHRHTTIHTFLSPPAAQIPLNPYIRVHWLGGIHWSLFDLWLSLHRSSESFRKVVARYLILAEILLSVSVRFVLLLLLCPSVPLSSIY